MVGTFSSAEQARKDPQFRDVVLRMAPIWTDLSDAQWLYVEQAMASTPERPYRQRVYRVAQDPDGTVESMVLSIPGDPLRYAGAWRERRPLNDLEPGLLQPLDGCIVFLQPDGPGRFRGGTRGHECSSTRDGAAYTTSEVLIDADAIETWDRGFDDAGRQVWGATAGPYRFVRISNDPAAPLSGRADASATPTARAGPARGARRPVHDSGDPA